MVKKGKFYLDSEFIVNYDFIDFCLTYIITLKARYRDLGLSDCEFMTYTKVYLRILLRYSEIDLDFLQEKLNEYNLEDLLEE